MSRSSLIIYFAVLILCGCQKQVVGQASIFNRFKKKSVAASLDFFQLKDTLFGKLQIISVLELPDSANPFYQVHFAYNRSNLLKTSEFAEENLALAAINGGFFNMKNGGSVAYFEINDTTVHFTNGEQKKWSKPGQMMNGAIILTDDGILDIHNAQPDGFYEESDEESAVLVTGPLLMMNSQKLRLAENSFNTTSHPRTCLCETKESVLFITVDGRRPNAWGMSLTEIQDLLSYFGCIDAVNLDGGGSTTMWIHGEIVNQPSDFTGERPVANAILIVEKNGRE